MPIDDFFGLISSAAETTWRVETTVTTQVSSTWNVPQQQVSATVSITWNTDFRVKANNEAAGFSQGILQPVVHPIDWKYTPAGSTWNVDQRRASEQTTTWKDIQRRSSKKSVKWQANVSIHASVTTEWKVLKRVYVPGYTAEDFYVGVGQPVVHPIDYQVTLITPQIAWNYEFRNNSKVNSRFNVDRSVISKKTTKWNTLDIHVVVQGASTWFTGQRLKTFEPTRWASIQRTNAKKKSAWFTDKQVVSQRAANWRNTDKVVVIKALTTEYSLPTVVVHPISYYQSVIPEFQWNTVRRLSVTVKSTFSTHTIVKGKRSSTWNTLLRMSVPNFGQTYYPQIDQPATHPITAKTYPWISRITWNFSDPVSVIKAVSWKTLNNVTKTAALKWNTVGRPGSQIAVSFNVRNPVQATVVVKWNTGTKAQLFIRQSAMSREDFAY